jgi:hypothetical protein
MKSVITRRLFSLCVSVVLASSSLAVAEEWVFEIHGGLSANAPNTLTIRQDGHPVTRVRNSQYETRPFVTIHPAQLTENYYAVRLGYYPMQRALNEWDFGFEVEWLHNRAIYVRGDDPEGVIRHFELTNGLNQLLINGAARLPFAGDEVMPDGRLDWIVRAGVSPVITWPASDIRGKRLGLDNDWFGWFAGFGGQVATQVRYYITPWLAVSAEIKGTTAVTSNAIAEGTADATFHSVHINFGFVYRLDANR